TALRSRVARGVRARRARSVADVLRADVAVVGAPGPVRLEHVGRARRARPVARLWDVALAGRSAAERARVPGRMRAGRRADRAVADVGRAGVRVGGAGRARGLHVVGGAGAAAAGTRLREIALVRRRAARRAGGDEAARP